MNLHAHLHSCVCVSCVCVSWCVQLGVCVYVWADAVEHYAMIAVIYCETCLILYWECLDTKLHDIYQPHTHTDHFALSCVQTLPRHVLSMSWSDMSHRLSQPSIWNTFLSAGWLAIPFSSHGSPTPTPTAKTWMPCLRAISASGSVASWLILDNPSVITITASIDWQWSQPLQV